MIKDVHKMLQDAKFVLIIDHDDSIKVLKNRMMIGRTEVIKKLDEFNLKD